MSGYAGYVVRRLGQFVLVVFVGISLIFLVTHLTPIDPVQQTITALSTYGQTSPEAVALACGRSMALWLACSRSRARSSSTT